MVSMFDQLPLDAQNNFLTRWDKIAGRNMVPIFRSEGRQGARQGREAAESLAIVHCVGTLDAHHLPQGVAAANMICLGVMFNALSFRA